MDSRETELNRVGKKIRDALDTEPASGEEVRLGRQRFVEYVTTRNLAPSSGNRRSWFGAARRISVGMLGVSAVAAAVAFYWRLPISFQVDSDAGPAAIAGTAGDLIEANAVVPTEIRFSEGSSIVLERG